MPRSTDGPGEGAPVRAHLQPELRVVADDAGSARRRPAAAARAASSRDFCAPRLARTTPKYLGKDVVHAPAHVLVAAAGQHDHGRVGPAGHGPGHLVEGGEALGQPQHHEHRAAQQLGSEVLEEGDLGHTRDGRGHRLLVGPGVDLDAHRDAGSEGGDPRAERAGRVLQHHHGSGRSGQRPRLPEQDAVHRVPERLHPAILPCYRPKICEANLSSDRSEDLL